MLRLAAFNISFGAAISPRETHTVTRSANKNKKYYGVRTVLRYVGGAKMPTV